MLTDVRFAVRALLRTPGFTAAAALCIALGVGANAAVFSALDAVLLHPLPTPALDRLVVLRDNLPTFNLLDAEVSAAEAHDLAARGDLFEASTAFTSANLTLSGTGAAERLSGVRTTGDFFRVFGTRPAVGRFYSAEHSWRGQHRVAVLSYGFWQERFGGDPAAVGRTLTLNGEPHEVVGVLPREFRYPRAGQLWLPYAMDSAALGNRGRLNMTAVARLRPGVTPERLRAGLRDETGRWQQRFPGPDGYASFGHSVTARPFVDFLAGQMRPVLLLLTGAVALVLLIACANVASLQLVRAGARARSLAVRAALGAG
ncbi:MAG: Acidobacterial duplicated orphan permease (function unknown), partial [uncultured Gemmatimonadaceae bacterium]